MDDLMEIKSYKGTYQVTFSTEPFAILPTVDFGQAHLIIDENVFKLYERQLLPFRQKAKSCLLINIDETAKSLENFPKYIEFLVKNGVRRGDQLVAIGGGITQDITAFLASTLLRGLDWILIPTTLLAQADSCIGSKSSINVGGYKNILGTFLPPSKIEISPKLLETLTPADFRSGIGEMLKVHAIAGIECFQEIADNYDSLAEKPEVLLKFIKKSLEIKKSIIEIDEFDKKTRLVMNYGHTFGHALEAASHFKIPHGIAVCFGMNMANFVAHRLSYASDEYFKTMEPVLSKNCEGFDLSEIDYIEFMEALVRDKKHTASDLRLILPLIEKNRIGIASVKNDENFKNSCVEYFNARK